MPANGKKTELTADEPHCKLGIIGKPYNVFTCFYDNCSGILWTGYAACVAKWKTEIKGCE